MRDGPTDEVLAGTCQWGCRITSWLGGDILADNIPVSGGSVSADSTQDVLTKLTMTVPRYTSITGPGTLVPGPTSIRVNQVYNPEQVSGGSTKDRHARWSWTGTYVTQSWAPYGITTATRWTTNDGVARSLPGQDFGGNVDVSTITVPGDAYPVSPGDLVTVSSSMTWSWTTGATTHLATLRFYDVSGNAVGSGYTSTGPKGGEAVVSAVAPAGAAYAIGGDRFNGPSPGTVSDWLEVTAIKIEIGTTGAYFSGNSVAEGIFTYAWEGTANASQSEQFAASYTVESASGVFDWRPGETDYTHPLARYGQQLDVTIIVTSVATGTIWQVPIGRYRITDWAYDDIGTVTVNAEGLLGLCRDDLFTSPTSPASGATLATEALRIAPGGMTVSYDPTLTDRACPKSMAWSDSKLAALQEIANAWPALLRSDDYGGVYFAAPLPAIPTPVLYLTDGVGGTVVAAPRSDTRSQVYNRVIASSSNSSSTDISATADVTDGPMSVNGSYGVVALKWSSPLITSASSAAASAATMLQNSLRPALSIPVSMAPDPRIELDDPVQITRDGESVWGYVISYQIPLTTGDSMQLNVGVTS